MNKVRPTAVAGLFYPESKTVLRDWLRQNLRNSEARQQIPRALIAPHAGYLYSGRVAAKSFELWRNTAGQIKTVVIIGPAHRVGFYGMSTVDFDAMATPLGDLVIDHDLRAQLLQQFDFLSVHNMAHAPEHSLEVELPFIKYLLPDAKVLPLLIGSISAQEVAAVLKELWQQEGVYFVISSDLSHFLNSTAAQHMDSATAEMIESGDWRQLDGEHACGYKGIQGLLFMLQEQSSPLLIKRLEMLNSGDTTGDKSRVVGYGAWAFYEGEEI